MKVTMTKFTIALFVMALVYGAIGFLIGSGFDNSKTITERQTVEVLVPTVSIVTKEVPVTSVTVVTNEVPVITEKVKEVVVEKLVTPNVQIHAEWELEVPHLWEVDPPTRINIIMWPDSMQIYKDSAQVRCENMGGSLYFYPKSEQYVCENVDY